MNCCSPISSFLAGVIFFFYLRLERVSAILVQMILIIKTSLIEVVEI